jgi:hypothetical protein
MVAQLIVFLAALVLVACNRLSPAEAKLVGSWKTQTSLESVTIFTFETNYTNWCSVTRPKHYRAAFEQIDHNTIQLDGITPARADRPPKPSKQALFSP